MDQSKIKEFPKTLKSFILANPSEFIGKNLDDTRKNIRVFTEVATAQFVNRLMSQNDDGGGIVIIKGK